MSDTSIEWTSKTWNPIRGCTRVSEGCRNCYAERMAARNLPEMRSPTTGRPFAVRTEAGPRWTGAVELIPSKLDEPLTWRKPQRIFVNSMSDLFHEALSDDAIDQVFAVMALAAHHTFQILTKRPERMRAYLSDLSTVARRWSDAALGIGMPDWITEADWLHGSYHGHSDDAVWLRVDSETDSGTKPLTNVWLGVSVEDQATADERIPLLFRTPAAVRFISLEPQLASVDVRPYVSLLEVKCCPRCGLRTNSRYDPVCPNDGTTLGPDVRLDWVIQGGESGPGSRPFDLSWARAVRHECRSAQGGPVPYFLKQLGAHVVWNGIQGGGIPSWPRETGHHDTGQGHWRKHLVDRKGGDMAEWPSDLRVREWPQVRA